MIVCIQGYERRRNATLAAAMISGMMSMQSSDKTLVIQLVDYSVKGAEDYLNGVAKSTGVHEISLQDTGIDYLMQIADGREITAADFSQICDAILQKENRLDVTGLTKLINFLELLPNRMEEIENIIEYAQDVYDNILIVAPPMDSSNADVLRYLNGKAEASIYCLTQGSYPTKEVLGERVIYLYPDFESDSKFTLKDVKRRIKGKSEVYKFEHDRHAMDSAEAGELVYFIKRNRTLDGVQDANTQWVKDVKTFIKGVFDEEPSDEDPEWTKLNYVTGTEYKKMRREHVEHREAETTLETLPEEGSNKKPKKGGGFFASLFGGGGKKKSGADAFLPEGEANKGKKDKKGRKKDKEEEKAKTPENDVQQEAVPESPVIEEPKPIEPTPAPVNGAGGLSALFAEAEAAEEFVSDNNASLGNIWDEIAEESRPIEQYEQFVEQPAEGEIQADGEAPFGEAEVLEPMEESTFMGELEMPQFEGQTEEQVAELEPLSAEEVSFEGENPEGENSDNVMVLEPLSFEALSEETPEMGESSEAIDAGVLDPISFDGATDETENEEIQESSMPFPFTAEDIDVMRRFLDFAKRSLEEIEKSPEFEDLDEDEITKDDEEVMDGDIDGEEEYTDGGFDQTSENGHNDEFDDNNDEDEEPKKSSFNSREAALDEHSIENATKDINEILSSNNPPAGSALANFLKKNAEEEEEDNEEDYLIIPVKEQEEMVSEGDYLGAAKNLLKDLEKEEKIKREKELDKALSFAQIREKMVFGDD